MAFIGRLCQRGVRGWLLIGFVSQGIMACGQPIEILQPEPVEVVQPEEPVEVLHQDKPMEVVPSILRNGPTLGNAQLSSITILPVTLPNPALASEQAEVPEKAVAVTPSADQRSNRQQASPDVVTSQAEPAIVEKSAAQGNQVPDQPDVQVTTGKDNSADRVEGGGIETARVPERAPDVGLGDVRLSDIGLGDTGLGDVRLGDIGLGGTGLGNVSLGDIGLGDLELGGDDDDDDDDDD